MKYSVHCSSWECKRDWLKSRDDVEEHLEVAHERVCWVDESSRAILLVSKVTGPGKAIADQEHAEALRQNISAVTQ